MTPRPGVCCPKCGSRLFKVVRITHRRDATRRVVRCRKCRHRIRTVTRIESTAA